MSSLSGRMRAVLRGLGLPALCAGIVMATQAAALAAADTSVPNPYYYGSYPGPPTWFWILVFPGILAALAFPLFNGWINNAYRDANAKLRNQKRG